MSNIIYFISGYENIKEPTVRIFEENLDENSVVLIGLAYKHHKDSINELYNFIDTELCDETVRYIKSWNDRYSLNQVRKTYIKKKCCIGIGDGFDKEDYLNQLSLDEEFEPIELVKLKAVIANQEELLNNANYNISACKKQLKLNRVKIAEQEETITRQNHKIVSLETTINSYSFERYKQAIDIDALKDKTIQQMASEIKKLQREINLLSGKLERQTKRINNYDRVARTAIEYPDYTAALTKIEELEETVKAKNRHINALLKTNRSMNALKNELLELYSFLSDCDEVFLKDTMDNIDKILEVPLFKSLKDLQKQHEVKKDAVDMNERMKEQFFSNPPVKSYYKTSSMDKILDAYVETLDEYGEVEDMNTVRYRFSTLK